MKKLLSLCLAVVMMVCLLAGVTVNAVTTDGTHQYYYFHLGDFLNGTEIKANGNLQTPGYDRSNRLQMVNVGNYTNSAAVNASNYQQNSGGYYYGTARAEQVNASKTLEIYTPVAGVYNIWMLAPHNGAPLYSVPSTASGFATFTQGWTVAVNGGEAMAINNEDYNYNAAGNKIAVAEGEIKAGDAHGGFRYNNQFYWDSVSVNLQAGKNEINLTATVNQSNIAAMLVTNNTAMQSDKFAYIGDIDMFTMLGHSNVNYTWQSIKYFGDGQYHENWAAEGFINLADYSDGVAPTVEITEPAECTDNSIEFSWTQADEGFSITDKYTPTFPGKTFGGNLQGKNGGTTKFYDASGIYEVRIYENDVLVETLPGTATSYTFEAPFTGSNYNFKVEVVDHFGNVATDTATFSTTGPEDAQAPWWPDDAEIRVENTTLSSTITWPVADDNTQIFGYEIYAGSVAPENLIEAVPAGTTSYTVDLLPGETKDIVVIAKDRVGLSSTELSATVSSIAGTENYLLRSINFDVDGVAWRHYNISSAMMTAGCPRLNASPGEHAYGWLLRSLTANAEISAKVWVDTPGEYTVFIVSEQSGKGTELSINGIRSTTEFGSATGGTFVWEKSSRTWTLAAGWNTVTLKALAAGAHIPAIYLTNGVDVETSDITYKNATGNVVVDGKINTAIYEDFTAPEVTFNAIADANGANANKTFVTLTWSATDNTEVAECEVDTGAGYVKNADGTVTVEDLWAGSNYTFKVRVTDKFGKSTEATRTIRTNGPADENDPVWPDGAELTVENAAASATITWPVATDDRDLFGYEIYAGSVAPENLIEAVPAGTTSSTVPLNLCESKEIIVVAIDRAENKSAELSATVTSLAGTENFLIRHEHFDMPDDSLRLWRRSNIAGANVDAGCLLLNSGAATGYTARGDLVGAATAGAEVSAKIYVDTPGEYTAFMHVLQGGAGIRLAIDGQQTATGFGSTPVMNDAGVAKWDWEKADRTWYFDTPGWKEVKVISETNAGSFTVIYITNGITVDATELAYKYNNATSVIDGKLNTAIYDDVAGPTFAAGNVTVAYDSVANEATVTWPAATDVAERSLNGSEYDMAPTGLQSYKVYVNDAELADVDNATTSVVIDETNLGRALVPGEVIKIKVEALDVFGNKSIKELSYEVSKFVISSFDIKNSTGVADTLLLLNDGTVQAELVIKNVSEVAADVRLAIAIYDATGNLLFGDNVDHTVAADGADDTVTVTISGAPTDLTGCKVKAHLWHAGNLSPASTQWTTITIQ